MKTINGTATANTAYGKTIPALPYSFSYEAFENIAEVESAKKLPTEDEVVKLRNDEALANAKSKALKAALDGKGYVKPTPENDEQARLQLVFKGLMTAKNPDGTPMYTVESGRKMAETATGCTWAE
jgi:hypothetical protein